MEEAIKEILLPRRQPREVNGYPCEEKECEEKSDTAAKRNAHIKTIHKKPFRCDFCEKNFAYPKDLDRHNNTKDHLDHYANKAPAKPFKCETCDEPFSRKDNYQRHLNGKKHAKKKKEMEEAAMLTAYDDNERETSPAASETSKASAKSYESLVQSVKRTFTSLSLTGKHETEASASTSASELAAAAPAPKKTKLIKTPCSEPGCGKSFFLKKDMEKHVRETHPTILCPEPSCEKTYLSQQDLDKHVRDKHPGLSEAEEPPLGQKKLMECPAFRFG